jgi:hypothetical protein
MSPQADGSHMKVGKKDQKDQKHQQQQRQQQQLAFSM